MRKTFRIFLYLSLFYLLVTTLVLPPILTAQLKKIHLQQTGRQLQLDGSWVNPLSLAMGLEELVLLDTDGELLLGLDELSANFSLLGTLFGDGIRFDSVAVDGLRVHVRQQTRQDGTARYNFADILDHRQTRPAPESEPHPIVNRW